jgi:predicted exporter
MPIRFLLFLLILFTCSWAISAQSTADSLIQLLPQTKNDTTRARLYKAIADNLEDRAKALVYAKRGLDLVKKMHWGIQRDIWQNLYGPGRLR